MDNTEIYGPNPILLVGVINVYMKHFGQLLVNLFHLLRSYILKAQVSGLPENLLNNLTVFVCTRYESKVL
jgi:hypothetical protein